MKEISEILDEIEKAKSIKREAEHELCLFLEKNEGMPVREAFRLGIIKFNFAVPSGFARYWRQRD